MLADRLMLNTLKNAPSDGDAISHKLLVQAGFVLKHGAGLYSFAPLGLRVLEKVKIIVTEEMESVGSLQVQMPIMQPATLWQQTGRWDVYEQSNLMFTFRDRKKAQYGLAPTAEEVATELAKSLIKSAKQLPVTVFQIQSKFRDELRPRFGLLRTREFVMMDGYSFDKDSKGLEETYAGVAQAYARIFARMDLNHKVVTADTGDMGGARSEEFMALADIGEDTILYTDNYAANQETATSLIDRPVAAVEAFGFRTIGNDVATVIALVPAGLAVNEIKLKNALRATGLESVGRVYNGALKDKYSDSRIIADESLKGVSPETLTLDGEPLMKDSAFDYVDIRLATEGELSLAGVPLQKAKGIEIGHIFQLGTKYTEALGATVATPDGVRQPLVMGCYGIGISRAVAAIIEQHHDDKGIIWPIEVAPYHVHLVPVRTSDETMGAVASEVYDALRKSNIEVVLDTRSDSLGARLADADLIGVPFQVVVGKGAAEGIVEVKMRATSEKCDVHKDDLVQFISEKMDNSSTRPGLKAGKPLNRALRF